MDDTFAFGTDPNPRPPGYQPPELPEIRPPSGPPPVSATRVRRPPQPVEIDLARLARFLYSHNPFYCISAFLVLAGLIKSFHLHNGTLQPELLMTGLAGYALLLAAVACLLIRAGRLWEDIRTILLLIVLIFLAISMSFDEMLAAHPAVGRCYFLGGLAFATMVSEVVLRGVKLRLPALYRLPYYLALGLFFLYPLLLGPWQDQENDPHLRWLLAGFAPLAGLIALTLLPAARRGASYVRDNGSPWQWPWYPWPLFVFLAVGISIRTYAICVSFHPSRGPATMFEPYFLVPFLMAVNMLLLEVAIHARRPQLLHWAMAAPLGLLLLATWTFDSVPPSINLRRMLLVACGCSPLFLTLAAVTLFYAVAVFRRVPQASHWLTASILMLAWVGPTKADFWPPATLHAWPFLLLTAMQLYAAIRSRSGLHSLLTALAAVAALCITWPEAIGTRCLGAIPLHLVLLAMLVIGAILHDRVAAFLQRAAVLGILATVTFVISGEAERWSAIPSEALMIYPGVMLLVTAIYGYWIPNRWYRIVPLLILAAWLASLSGRSYRSLRAAVAGLDLIAAGLACLLAGLMVSLWKLRLPQSWFAWLVRPPAPLTHRANAADARGGEKER